MKYKGERSTELSRIYSDYYTIDNFLGSLVITVEPY